MIKCLSLGLLFVASSIGLSLLFSDVSNAQSEYDNTYHTTDILELKHMEQETTIDVTEDIYSIIHGLYEDEDVYFFELYNTSGSRVNITNNQERLDFLRNLISTDEGLYWSESQIERSNGQMSVERCSNTKDNLDKKLVGNFGVYTGEKILRADVLNNSNDTSLSRDTLKIDIKYESFGAFPNRRTGITVTFANNRLTTDCLLSTETQNPNDSNFGMVARNLYSNLFDIQYPENYNGKEIRDTFNPIRDKTFTPEWSWSVTQDGKFTVTSQNNENANLDAEAVFDLWKDSKNWEFPSTQIVDSERQRPYHSAKFEHQLVKEEQWFTVTLQYYWQFCLMEGTCEDEKPHGITHIETVIFQIYWDGKSFIAGNNANGQEDCELQEDGGIYRRICNSEEQEPVIMRTLRGLNSDMHGLTQIVTAPLSFISSLITYNNNCTALSLPLPSAMNRDLNLPCMTPYYQQYLGFLFNLYQTILTALVCYYCFVNTLAYVKRGQNPKNDRIEVAHL